MNDSKDTGDGGWYSNDAATFGDRVAGAREALGMGQADLARKLGVKLKTVQNWEEDLAEPRANKLQLLSGVLNVSLMWLLNGEGEGVQPPDAEEALPEGVDEILAELRDIKAQMGRAGDRLSRAERKLRKVLREAGP
jgi:transcriptional regulator with XRE-family HTH domain